MRRADRLIQLIGLLKQQPLSLADKLAERLEVSVRTIYRDIAVLQARGFAIEGQAGVGYLVRAPIHLPPLTFDHDELEALALGLAYVEAVGDPALAAAARSARGKVDLVWSNQLSAPPSQRQIRASQRPERRAPAFAAVLRGAVRAKRVVHFHYEDGQARSSERRVRPLAIIAFSDGWLLIGWCLLRTDFRVFRMDRMRELGATADAFIDEPGRTLADYFALRTSRPQR